MGYSSRNVLEFEILEGLNSYLIPEGTSAVLY